MFFWAVFSGGCHAVPLSLMRSMASAEFGMLRNIIIDGFKSIKHMEPHLFLQRYNAINIQMEFVLSETLLQKTSKREKIYIQIGYSIKFWDEHLPVVFSIICDQTNTLHLTVTVE
jgi:hypothetical protein